ncbi:hypothetical protein HYH03_014398 [Edaphochlamys debaryana]|uniref:Uncharacterized protein n=1 Tax=Edaphochlamys debaryana TaxID=47281 RepID=A0A836BTI2_9CHLO|nr:hypothetical protein HYH03_014398 [Edaphochlamys debaryana]|eukprot:KAG2486898.1 hypothetical protein HYH03_014398 [Edaphochlamys debaryana]
MAHGRPFDEREKVLASLLKEHHAHDEVDDVLRDARARHHNSMHFMQQATRAVQSKQSLVRLQYDRGRAEAAGPEGEDTASLCGTSTLDLRRQQVPKSISIKPVPRFGSLLTPGVVSAQAPVLPGALTSPGAGGLLSAPDPEGPLSPVSQPLPGASTAPGEPEGGCVVARGLQASSISGAGADEGPSSSGPASRTGDGSGSAKWVSPLAARLAAREAYDGGCGDADTGDGVEAPGIGGGRGGSSTGPTGRSGRSTPAQERSHTPVGRPSSFAEAPSFGPRLGLPEGVEMPARPGSRSGAAADSGRDAPTPTAPQRRSTFLDAVPAGASAAAAAAGAVAPARNHLFTQLVESSDSRTGGGAPFSDLAAPPLPPQPPGSHRRRRASAECDERTAAAWLAGVTPAEAEHVGGRQRRLSAQPLAGDLSRWSGQAAPGGCGPEGELSVMRSGQSFTTQHRAFGAPPLPTAQSQPPAPQYLQLPRPQQATMPVTQFQQMQDCRRQQLQPPPQLHQPCPGQAPSPTHRPVAPPSLQPDGGPVSGGGSAGGQGLRPTPLSSAPRCRRLSLPYATSPRSSGPASLTLPSPPWAGSPASPCASASALESLRSPPLSPSPLASPVPRLVGNSGPDSQGLGQSTDGAAGGSCDGFGGSAGNGAGSGVLEVFDRFSRIVHVPLKSAPLPGQEWNYAVSADARRPHTPASPTAAAAAAASAAAASEAAANASTASAASAAAGGFGSGGPTFGRGYSIHVLTSMAAHAGPTPPHHRHDSAALPASPSHANTYSHAPRATYDPGAIIRGQSYDSAGVRHGAGNHHGSLTAEAQLSPSSAGRWRGQGRVDGSTGRAAGDSSDGVLEGSSSNYLLGAEGVDGGSGSGSGGAAEDGEEDAWEAAGRCGSAGAGGPGPPSRPQLDLHGHLEREMSGAATSAAHADAGRCPASVGTAPGPPLPPQAYASCPLPRQPPPRLAVPGGGWGTGVGVGSTPELRSPLSAGPDSGTGGSGTGTGVLARLSAQRPASRERHAQRLPSQAHRPTPAHAGHGPAGPQRSLLSAGPQGLRSNASGGGAVEAWGLGATQHGGSPVRESCRTREAPGEGAAREDEEARNSVALKIKKALSFLRRGDD